jgi:hypothetical protein
MVASRETKRKEKIEEYLKVIEEKTDFTVLSEMKAALNSVYGEERNQIVKPSYESAKEIATRREDDAFFRHLDGYEGERLFSILKDHFPSYFQYSAIIHFPEITIKNDSRKHLIRDMYVKFNVRPNGTINPYIEGVRTTVTEGELRTGYFHSHLPQFSPMYIRFEGFCTGVGEINQVLALLNTKYTTANFMMLLMHIRNFLEWESREGNPFMYMKDIIRRSAPLSEMGSLNDRTAERVSDWIVEKLRALSPQQLTELLTFNVTERYIKVRPTLEMEKWMANTIRVSGPYVASADWRRLVAVRNSEGVYYSLPSNASQVVHQTTPILNFKGKDLTLQVIEKTETTTHEIFTVPKITKTVGEKLSSILSKTALRSAGIKSGSSIEYSTRTSGTDNISVSTSVE